MASKRKTSCSRTVSAGAVSVARDWRQEASGDLVERQTVSSGIASSMREPRPNGVSTSRSSANPALR